MTLKTRKVFMALVGAYLVYTGSTLIVDVTRSNPKNMAVYVAIGAFFAVFGLATIVWNIKVIIDESKKEREETAQEDNGMEYTETVEEDGEESELDEVELDEDAEPVDEDKEGEE